MAEIRVFPDLILKIPRKAAYWRKRGAHRNVRVACIAAHEPADDPPFAKIAGHTQRLNWCAEGRSRDAYTMMTFHGEAQAFRMHQKTCSQWCLTRSGARVPDRPDTRGANFGAVPLDIVGILVLNN